METEKRPSLRHSTDVFFTLSLFCVFAAAAFLTVMIGIQVYQRTAEQMQDTYTTRTAISYVTEKLRRHDAEGRVALGTLEGEDALILTDEAGGRTYLTYIYAQDGWLWELTVGADASPTRSQGEQILEVKDFSVTDRGDGFLELSAASESGAIDFLLHLRSE